MIITPSRFRLMTSSIHFDGFVQEILVFLALTHRCYNEPEKFSAIQTNVIMSLALPGHWLAWHWQYRRLHDIILILKVLFKIQSFWITDWTLYFFTSDLHIRLRIVSRGVPGSATDYRCGVRGYELTTYLLYGGPILGLCCFNDGWCLCFVL